MSVTNLEAFRADVRVWVENNFPKALAGVPMSIEGEAAEYSLADFELWRARLAEKGWGAPTWPMEYGGAGLSDPEGKVISQEIARVGTVNPIPRMVGMGVTMVGPTILEYGTEEQKAKHLPGIASGTVRWCLGLSEPNAGSDLASLTTKAEDDGDSFRINGQKVWTSGAHLSQWCGAVVRTDQKAAKREGISFVMLPMDQEGIKARKIQLISGGSSFCETFFDNARADKSDLLGPLNGGWSVVKRLLEHERASQTRARSISGGGPRTTLQQLAKDYIGTDETGALADPDLRIRLVNHLMDAQAHRLTTYRIREEAKGTANVSPAVSIMKNSATRVSQSKAELTLELMGAQGVGWEGDAFKPEELSSVRDWLVGKAYSIAGGTYEVQNNIISKNILGLPETTQQG